MNVGSYIPLFSKRRMSIAILGLALAVGLAGTIIALPHYRTAHASGATLTVTPTSARYSPLYSLLTVQGSNYAAKETVKVYWNYTGPGTGTFEVSGPTDATGAFTAQFETPLAPTGTYTIAGVGQTSGLVATASFQLLPLFSISPHASGPGTRLTLTGNAFGASETVKIYWNYTGPGTGMLLTTATSDSTGSFTVHANVPTNTPGDIPTAAIGQSTNAISKYTFIIYPPTLMLAPLSGSANAALALSAYGFRGNETVNFYWNNGTTPIASGKASSYGYIVTDITVPAGSAPGNYSVKAVGGKSGIAITNTYTVVAPSSSLTVTSGPVGVRVHVLGDGYAPGETVNILWNYSGPGTGTNVGSVTVGFAGTVRVAFKVPTASTGSYSVAVVGATSNRITQNTFTVSKSLATNPTSSSPGTSVTVTGTGFKANESVQLHWDSATGTLLAAVAADANGNIRQVVTLPVTATPGSHSIVGVGQTSGRSFTASVTIDTGWGDFGFDHTHSRENSFENTVGPTDVGNLKLKWTATASAKSLKTSPVYANGIVYIATIHGFLDAYNGTTGNLLWQFNTNTGFNSLSSPLVDAANGLVFFGVIGREGSGVPSPFYALDSQTGTLKWSMILAGNEFDFPTMVPPTLYFGISNEGDISQMYAIDELSGHMLWQDSTNGGIWGAVAVDTSTNTLFSIVGNPSDTVIALNVTTGALIWQFSVPSFSPDDDPSSGIAVANGLAYLNSKNGHIYALHESDGTLAWSTSIGSEIGGGDVSTQAVAASGTLYVGSLDTNLYALNATTGAVLWKASTNGGIDSSPAVANGVVYFASFDKNIYAVNAATGAILWSFTTGGSAYSSPIMVNGWLYCGSTDGKLYAFSL